MRSTNKLILLFALMFATSAFAAGQTPQATPETKTPTAADYEALLSKLKAGDTSIDFVKFRMAFTATKNYSYSGSDRDERNKMMKLLSDKDHQKAFKAAEKMLEKEYVNSNAHYVAYVSNKELKNTEKADFHRRVLLGLLNSMKGDNDGFSAGSPFYAITIEEEYTAIRFLGYQVKSQSLQHIDGHSFDVFDVTNSKGETAKLYFNIDPIWKAETELFTK